MSEKFEVTLIKPDNSNRIMIDIPFNIWDLFQKKGNIAVRGTINGVVYQCGLLPRGKGKYSLPFNKEMQKNTGAKFGDKLSITIEIDDTSKISKPIDSSKIRKVNDINLVMQPNPKACGQACISMLANVPIEDVFKIMHTSGSTSIGQLIDALDHYNIGHAEKNLRVSKKNNTFPNICILTVHMSTYNHWVVYCKGKYYDPEFGLLEKCHHDGRVTSFLEIFS